MRATSTSISLVLAVACLGGATMFAAQPALAQAMAKGGGYKILSEDGAGDRRSIAIRLPGRVSEAEIKRIAEELIAKRRATSGRIVVRLFLDGMALDQTPWAVASVQAELKIAISGLKLEEEELFISELRNDRRQIVGAWLTSPPAVPGRLLIFRDKGKVFAEWRLRNGLKTIDELGESRIGRGRRYDVKGDNAGHFVVTAAGVLELRDADRLIAVAEAITPEKLGPAPHGAAPVAQSAVPLAPATAPLPSQAASRDAVAEDHEQGATPPITAAEPKPQPQPRKRVARPQPVSPAAVKSAARDAGPIMRLQGQ